MTPTTADLRAELAARMTQRAAWRRLLAEAYPDNSDQNALAFETLTAWAQAMSEMDDDDPALAPLAAAARQTGKREPRVALTVLGIEPHKALSRVACRRGPETLSELLREWAETAAGSLSLHDEGA